MTKDLFNLLLATLMLVMFLYIPSWIKRFFPKKNYIRWITLNGYSDIIEFSSSDKNLKGLIR